MKYRSQRALPSSGKWLTAGNVDELSIELLGNNVFVVSDQDAVVLDIVCCGIVPASNWPPELVLLPI